MKTNAAGLALIRAFTDEYDTADSRTAAEKIVTLSIKVELTSNQFSALVCLAMHLGTDHFRDSRIVRLINQSRPNALVKAADQFDLYIYHDDDTGKRVPDPFLIKQRELEKALFLMPELVRKRR